MDDHKLSQLQQRFAEIYSLRRNLLRRDYALVQIARQFDLPTVSCRRMFYAYCTQRWLNDPWLRLEKWSESLSRLALFLFNRAESIAIAASLVLYFTVDAHERQKRVRYETLQVIYSMQEGPKISKARIKILETLNADRADLTTLVLVDKSLTNIDLERANLQGAILNGSELQEANLGRANLRAAELIAVNFLNANLRGAELQGAVLQDADLDGADLRGAQHLDPEQVKLAKNWACARYDEAFRRQLGRAVLTCQTSDRKAAVRETQPDRPTSTVTTLR